MTGLLHTATLTLSDSALQATDHMDDPDVRDTGLAAADAWAAADDRSTSRTLYHPQPVTCRGCSV